MSLDILSNISKEGVLKKGLPVTGNSKDDTSSKKEGGSLFDSLMKDIQKDKQTTTIQKNDTQKTETNNSKIENKLASDDKLNPKKEQGGTLEASKKVSEGLVDLVVEKVKNKSNVDIEKSTDIKKVLNEVESKSTEKANVVKNNEEIKLTVDNKVITIKEAVEDIKNEISKINKDDTEAVKGIKKVLNEVEVKIAEQTSEKANVVKNNEEIKLIVDNKVITIKEAVEDIKNEISKINKDDADKATNAKKVLNEVESKSTEKANVIKNNEEIKLTVDNKVITIKEAVEDIKNEISKINKDDTDKAKDIKDIEEATNVKKVLNEVEVKSTEKANLLKNNEEIKVKIESKVTTITEAVEDIKNQVSKIDTSVQSSEVIEEIQNSNDTLAKETSKNSITQNKLVLDSKIVKNEVIIDGKTTLLANGFLNSQQQNKQTVSLTQISNAKENIENNKTLKSVKDSASMLDLNLEKVNVEHSDKSGKVEKIDILSKQERESQLQMLQNRGFSKFAMEKDGIVNDEQLIKNAQLEKISSIETQAQKEKNVMLNVPQTVVETIQTKIIGAQQKVGSFMSEVARNMYLNYKPPFTAFRMNLNPANLGSIAVVMRASKTDNSINVSMNMNNSSTMEVFAENKTALQTALQRQLGENSNVSLNFDMQEGGSNEQFNQQNHNNGSGGQNSSSNISEESTNTIIEEENTEELDYM